MWWNCRCALQRSGRLSSFLPAPSGLLVGRSEGELLVESVHRRHNPALKKFLLACCICVALSAISPSAAQYVRVGVQGQIPMGKLAEMEDALGFADAGQKVDLLTRLGVDPATRSFRSGE